MQYYKTRISKSESISAEDRRSPGAASFLFWPARIFSMLAMWVGMLLVISLSGMAAGTPGLAGSAGGPGVRGSGMTGLWDTYQIFITPVANNSIAGSGVNDVVRVTVVDVTLTTDINDPSTWVTVPDFQLSFTISGTTVSSTPTTNSSGYYDYGLASGVVGSADITIQGTGASNTVVYTFTYIAGPPETNPSSGSSNPTYFIVTQDPAVADGVSQDKVKIHVSNSYGVNFPAGTVIDLIITSSTPASADAVINNHITIELDASGTVEVPITDETVGSVTLQAFVDGNAIPLGGSGYTRTVHFVAGPPDPSKSYIVVTQDPAAADGVSQDIVTAYLFDSQGRPTSGTVNFTIESGTATFVTTVTGTGTVAAEYVSNTVNAVQVQAALADGTFLNDNNNPVNNYATIHFTAGLPDPAKSYIVVTQDPAAADGITQDIVTVYLFDSQGRPTTGAVTYSILSGTATPAGGSVASDNTVTQAYVSTTIGAVQVQAQVNGIYLTDQSNPGNNYVTIHFVVGPPDPSKSYIVVTQDPALANGTAQDIVTVYLFDAQGHAITDGTNVTFSISSGTATISGAATQGVTTGNVSALYVSNVVGDVQVQASYVLNGTTVYLNDLNNTANNYVTIHFVAGDPVSGDPGGGGSGGSDPGGGGVPPADGGGSGGGGGGGGGTGGSDGSGSGGSNLSYTVLFVRQDYRLADGTQQDSVIAYVTDANMHPLKNVQIQFFIQNTPTSGTATAGAQFVTDPTMGLTDDSGMARIAITSTTPGTVYINAILVANGVLIDGSYQIVTFVNTPDVKNPLTALSVVIYEALADGSQQTVVKAHIVDLDGNVMPGQEVTFTIDSGNAVIVTPQPVVTDANGDAYIYITSKTPGYVNITATVNGESITFGSPAKVKFAPINIYVPKVFTPNNDGTNDVLKPILVGISTFHYFSVYNRWGNLIYTTQDGNQGWDGTFKGVAQPVETYLWIAEGIDVSGKKIVQKGMTSLVR